MGAARMAYASYGGRRVQTRYFRETDSVWLTKNIEAASELIRAALREGATIEENQAGEVLIREVEGRQILEFLKAYQVHEDSPDLDTKLITRYIRKENAKADPSLLTWTIAIMGSAPTDSQRVLELDTRVRVGMVNRSKLKDTGGTKADIKTLMSKEHRVVDLNIQPSVARAKKEADLIIVRDLDPVYSRRGLLLIYPIARDSPPDQANHETRRALAAQNDVIGMAMVFPGNSTDRVENAYVQVDNRDVEIDDTARDEERAALSEEES
jgi:hypothetical protein